MNTKKRTQDVLERVRRIDGIFDLRHDETCEIVLKCTMKFDDVETFIYSRGISFAIYPKMCCSSSETKCYYKNCNVACLWLIERNIERREVECHK